MLTTMRMLAALGLLLSLAACQLGPAAAHTPSPAEIAAEQRSLDLAGFEPIATLAARGLEVQRLDPMWDLLDYPSIELTRDRADTVTVIMRVRGHEQKQVVAAEVWDRLAARAPEAFREADPKALRRRDREVVRQSGYCHSWHRLEAAIAGQTLALTVSPCMGDLQRASLAYAEDLARVAVASIALCEPERQVADVQRALWECGQRFGPPTDAHRKSIG